MSGVGLVLVRCGLGATKDTRYIGDQLLEFRSRVARPRVEVTAVIHSPPRDREQADAPTLAGLLQVVRVRLGRTGQPATTTAAAPERGSKRGDGVEISPAALSVLKDGFWPVWPIEDCGVGPPAFFEAMWTSCQQP
jgi:hypothetical protein